MAFDWKTELEEAWHVSYQAAGRHTEAILKAVADGQDWQEICFAGHISMDVLEFLVLRGSQNHGV